MTVTILDTLADGAGKKPVCGDKVCVHYVGVLASGGEPFDSSRERGHAFTFTVGVNKVIAGWDEALLDMPKGCRRKLLISSEDAYGERGQPPTIPPNANLIFDIEVLNINETLVDERVRYQREEEERVERFLRMQDEERAADAAAARHPPTRAAARAAARRQRQAATS